ncbi:MAG: hypothetical protein ACJA17_001016 [Polaribacter sp.]
MRPELAQNLIKKRVLGIEMASFYEVRRKDIIESPTEALAREHPKKHLL